MFCRICEMVPLPKHIWHPAVANSEELATLATTRKTNARHVDTPYKRAPGKRDAERTTTPLLTMLMGSPVRGGTRHAEHARCQVNGAVRTPPMYNPTVAE